MHGTPSCPTFSRRFSKCGFTSNDQSETDSTPDQVSKICTASTPDSTCPFKYELDNAVSRSRSSVNTLGLSMASALSAGKSRTPRPCTRYAASVQGPPANPSTGTRPESSFLTNRTVSMTVGAISSWVGIDNAWTAAFDRRGLLITGPGANSTLIPSALIGLMMSAKTMAASSGNRLIGISVTSAAKSGRAHSSSKEKRSRSARYSGR